MTALLHRFGRLVSIVAEKRNAKVDSVFDLARILRAPGTLNVKDDVPVETSLTIQGSTPLTVDQIEEILSDYGIEALEGDSEIVCTTVVSDPDGWGYGKSWCGYAKSVTDAFATDTPLNGDRHPFMVGKDVPRL